MPVIVATITPKPDQLEEVVSRLKELIPAVHEEDGCELYALHQGKDRVVFVEKWRDREALGVHSTGANIQALNEKLRGLVEGRPDVQVLEPVAAGDASKGAV